MSDGLSRRTFIKGSAALGATATVGGGMLGILARPVVAGDGAAAALAAITGGDPYRRTVAAVEAIGGMDRYVPAGARVVINANTAFKHRGSIVDPAVLAAALTMCTEAGAEEVWLLKDVPDGYWDRSEHASGHQPVIDSAKVSEREFEVVKVKGGVALAEAHVDRRLLETDVLINLAVAKHHKGCEYTGALKNAMGACPHEPTCRYFHIGSNPDAEGWYEDLGHLDQCIADLNRVRRPDLCILDATEILTGNGPFGPGPLASPGAVVAAADPVAIDAYGVRFLGMKPEAVGMIGRSERQRVGSADLQAMSIRELELEAL
jgi:uncharacterized protein (DUF362 family)